MTVDEVLELPSGAPRCAVLVLSGSSGRVETGRVRLLAQHGAAAASLRWFGGRGQPPGICEVPLETFGPVLDRLAGLHEHLAVVGTSKGAEAALLLAASDPRIRVVAALAPSAVVWANVGAEADGETYPYRSSWTLAGRPLPFVPYDGHWQPDADSVPPSYRGLYEQSLRIHPREAEQAVIPVERIEGEVLLAAGGDDQLWPSVPFAEQIVGRRAAHGLPTRLVTHPAAGHRLVLPGEPVVAEAAPRLARGGTPAADAALGAAAWRELLVMLHLVGL